jgi:hypothetical protein
MYGLTKKQGVLRQQINEKKNLNCSFIKRLVEDNLILISFGYCGSLIKI